MDIKNSVILSTIGIIFIASIQSSNAVEAEKRLVKHLLQNYEKVGRDGRPVVNGSDTVSLTIGFALNQILHFDQFVQVITIAGWLKLFWEDPLLKWVPAEFGDVESVAIPQDQIWIPDIVLFNSVDEVVDTLETPAHVGHDGKVSLISAQRYTMSCATAPEETNPSCELRFGSWVMDSSQIDLTLMNDVIEANFYVPHHDWELSTTKAERVSKEYKCCPDLKFVHAGFIFNLVKREEETDDDLSDLNLSASIHANIVLLCISSLLLLLH